MITAMPGQTADCEHSFWVPFQAVVSSALTYQLVDNRGLVVSQGQAQLLSTAHIADRLRLTVAASIVVPVNAPPSVEGDPYTVLLAVTLNNGVADVAHTSQLPLEVKGGTAANKGGQSAIELWGQPANLRLITGVPVTALAYAMYRGNELIVQQPSITPAPEATPDGFVYTSPYDTSALPGPQLDPYMVMWKYSTADATDQMEAGHLWAISPRIYQAALSLQQVIQRAVVNVDQTPDCVFQPQDLLRWLQQGRAHFNAFAHPTSFTMNNASDTVMYFWTTFAAINALRSQGLVESLKAFDYGGQQVTLSVDHASAFNDLASTLEQQVSENCRQFKTLLSKRGLTSGDGNVNGTELKIGAMGTVGISLTPVSNLRMYTNQNSWLGLNRIF